MFLRAFAVNPKPCSSAQSVVNSYIFHISLDFQPIGCMMFIKLLQFRILYIVCRMPDKEWTVANRKPVLAKASITSSQSVRQLRKTKPICLEFK